MARKTVVIRGKTITLGESNITLITRLAGTKYGGCQEAIKQFVRKGDILTLIPDEDNKHDDTAIMVVAQNKYKVGYIPNDGHTFQSKTRIFKGLYAGEPWKAIVNKIIKPSREFNFYNLFVEISQHK